MLEFWTINSISFQHFRHIVKHAAGKQTREGRFPTNIFQGYLSLTGCSGWWLTILTILGIVPWWLVLEANVGA